MREARLSLGGITGLRHAVGVASYDSRWGQATCRTRECCEDPLNPPPKAAAHRVDVEQRDRNVQNYESDWEVWIMALLG
jgi:hypothetical protein